MKYILFAVIIASSFFATAAQGKANESRKALVKARWQTATKSENEEIKSLLGKYKVLNKALKNEDADKRTINGKRREIEKQVDILLAAESESYKALVDATGPTSQSIMGRGAGPGSDQPPLHAADFSVFSEEDVMSVFLLVGQSNMKGRGAITMEPKTNDRNLFFHQKKENWNIARDPLHASGTPDLIDGSDNSGTGPGMSFAMTLLENKPDMSIGLIPAAVGGAGINLYKEDGRLYTRSLGLLSDAQKKSPIKTEIQAILWLQGESDSTEKSYKSYEKNLLSLVDRYRKDLNNPDLPFIACTIGSFIEPHKKFTRTKEINDILLSLPPKRKNTACLDARDLTGHIGDRVHYSTESQLEIGKRFASAYLKLTASKLGER